MGCDIALELVHEPPPRLDLMSPSGCRNQEVNLVVTHEELLR
jgi:hypothetical protein